MTKLLKKMVFVAARAFGGQKIPARAACLKRVTRVAKEDLEPRQVLSATTPINDLAIEMTTPELFLPGQTFETVITVTGSGDYVTDTRVYIMLPEGVTIQGSYSEWHKVLPGVYAWNVGGMIDGQRTTTVVSLGIDTQIPEMFIQASVSSQNDFSGWNNTAYGYAINWDSHPTDVGIATIADEFSFTVYVANFGPFAAENVEVSAFIPAEIVVTEVSYGFGLDQDYIWRKNIGSLAPGQSEVFKFFFRKSTDTIRNQSDPFFTAWSDNYDFETENNSTGFRIFL